LALNFISDNEFRRGMELFNQAHFFDAHEVWEDVWRAAPAPEKNFLQGLIQLAVGFHHHSTGNLVGARSLLRRGCGNLAKYADEHGGVNLLRIREEVLAWLKSLEEEVPLPPHPHVHKSAEPSGK
jgi:uncharacterized protein